MLQFLRSKRFWKRLAIGVGLLFAVLLIVNGFMAWRVESQLQARLTAVRAAGDPASIAELVPDPIPTDQNAAAFLDRIAPRIDEFSKDHGSFYDSPLGTAYDERDDRGEMPTAKEIESIRAILDKYPDIDAGLTAAAACDQYASTLDYSLDFNQFLDELITSRPSRFRQAARFVEWRNEVLVADGAHELAALRGVEMLRLARLFDHEPTVVSMLVGIAVRGIAANSLYDALAAGPVSSEVHTALDQELALVDDPLRMVRVLKTERACSINALMRLPAGTPQPPGWLYDMFGWSVKRYGIGVLDYYQKELALVDRPWFEMRKRVGHQKTPKEPSGYGTLVDLLVPAIQAVYEAEARNIATVRALRIFNALTRYRQEHGREASGLADLALPSEATIDPFSGEPLRLKLTDEGWIVYSVMMNGGDDGGDFKELKDYGVAPRKRRLTE